MCVCVFALQLDLIEKQIKNFKIIRLTKLIFKKINKYSFQGAPTSYGATIVGHVHVRVDMM